MHRFIILAVVLLTSLSLAACGGSEKKEPEEVTPRTGRLVVEVMAFKGPTLRSIPRLVGAEVSLFPSGMTAVTDREGKAVFPAVPAVTQFLEVKAEGFVSHEGQPLIVPADGEVLLPVYLHRVPEGPPEAALNLLSVGEEFAYKKEISLSIFKSENLVPGGIDWEVRDSQGQLVMNPYQPDIPLVPERSAIPGSTPTSYTLALPRPGTYSIELVAKNPDYPGVESRSSITVEAVNVPPVGTVSVIAGPNPPAKEPSEMGLARASSGLSVVPAGEMVYLKGWGIDVNAPAPEDYNPGGNEPDVYGKSQDHRQRLFGFSWSLEYSKDGRDFEDRSHLLEAADTQYPSFVARDPGRYRAILTISDNDPAGALTSEPAVKEIIVLADGYVSDDSCRSCHADAAAGYDLTGHARAGAAAPGCQDCHGPGALHLESDDKAGTIDVTYRSGLCGTCHEEYAEWEKSRHSDGYAYGRAEVPDPLLLNCVQCHYPAGYSVLADQGGNFKDAELEISMGRTGPDLSPFNVDDGEAISCAACHDPHPDSPKPAELRRGSPGDSCDTCHEEKWQNLLLEGTAGEHASAYEFPGEDYDLVNPHLTEDKCVTCHMTKAVDERDDKGHLEVGGHTLRMRSAGDNGRLGGYGPLPDPAAGERDSQDPDDILNTRPCLSCHPDRDSFDATGLQQRVYEKWVRLGEMLKERNGGVLPGYKPGDKCATCHRGGTLPFDDDPELILEQAYTNYKLVKNDRSWGIHNPYYIEKLLDDSIKSLERLK